MATTFKYADESALRGVFPEYHNYNPRKVIRDGWVVVAGDVWKIVDIGIPVSEVWFNEVKGTKVASSGNVDDAYEWYYNSTTDDLHVQVGAGLNPKNDEVVSVGEDNIEQALVNASMELSGMLDGRYPRPIPKVYQGIQDSDTDATESPQYDYMIIRATCLLTAKNLIRSVDATSELAQAFSNEVTNESRTGIVDKLNDGEYKLSFEIDRDDSSGNIIKGSSSGSSMELVETLGEYSGSLYDRIRITCSQAGGYGTAKVKIKTLNGDKLYGNESDEIVVTGGFQMMGGIWVRFEGSSMVLSSVYEVEVRNTNLSPTNSNAYSVGLIRK